MGNTKNKKKIKKEIKLNPNKKYEYHKKIVIPDEYIVYNLLEQEFEDWGEGAKLYYTHEVKTYFIIKEKNVFNTYIIFHEYDLGEGLFTKIINTDNNMKTALKRIEDERILRAIWQETNLNQDLK